jgi:hypothetical protein
MTCISTVPEKPFVQVIIPVVSPMLPAAPLLRLQLKPVLLVAVVEYVVEVVPFVNWHEGSAPAEIVIAVGEPTVGVTVIVAGAEYARAQTPLFTSTLNCVVAVRTPEVYVVFVFAISFHTVKGLTEYCHFVTVPVCPLNDISDEVEPVQIVSLEFTVPPTEVGSTLIVTFWVKAPVA